MLRFYIRSSIFVTKSIRTGTTAYTKPLMNFSAFNTSAGKNVKFGNMDYPGKLVAFEKKYIYAVLPIAQIASGHIIIFPKRRVLNFKDLDPTELFDLALALRYLPKVLESAYGGSAITVYVQNYSKEDELKGDRINHMFVHVISRKKDDYKKNDDIYPLLQEYDKDLRSEYNKKIVQGNVTSQRTLDLLGAEAQGLREKLGKAKENLA